MYGQDYLEWLDWRDCERALDAFIAGLPTQQRPYVEAIMRKRYDRQRDSWNLLSALQRKSEAQRLSSSGLGSSGLVGSIGSALGL